MNFFKKILPLINLLFLILSCRIDYDLAGGEDDESLPDILMEGVVQVQKTENSLIVLKADRAELFSQRGETAFIEMEFLDYGNQEALLRKGKAGRALLKDTGNTKLTGGVLIESLEDEILIEGEELNWESETWKLYSPPGHKIRLIQKREKEIEGTGFTSDFSLNEISFEQSVKGMVTIDE